MAAPTVEAGAPAGKALALLNRLDAVSRFVNRALAGLAGVALVAMMLFTVFDVVMRALGRPVAGSFEVIGWLSAVAMALALGYVQVHRGHVAMTLLTGRLEGRPLALLEVITGLMSMGLFAAVAWFLFRYGQVLQSTGSLSETLRIVIYPWVYVVTVGFAGLTLALFLDLLRSIGRLITGSSP